MAVALLLWKCLHYTQFSLTRYHERRVKFALDETAFYGGSLRVVYAPEFESAAECRVKIHSYCRYNDVVAAKAG